MGLFAIGRVKSARGAADPACMSGFTLAAGSLADVWIVNAAIAAWLVLMCLKTLGHGYSTAVRWHNLRIEAHNLRLRHQRELLGIQRRRRSWNTTTRPARPPREPEPDDGADAPPLADAA